ncbi:hypothetical protein ACFSKW_33790 [Nonomuraea mangrovi]|uniref:Uncharacterized protein n=1 Tax=Nonomuraea mangrovi TaxID=2316207 RepID=A0ABW4T530_9ACTN
MGSFDGMDPTLVRDLLAEVQRAAAQMRTIESRVAQATRTAGLATPATHRPSQVADACESMARDVTGRLALLEKKETAPRTGEQVKDVSANGTPASGKDEDPSPKETTGRDATGKETSGKEASGKEPAGKDTTPKDSTATDSTPRDPRETPREPRDEAKEPRETPRETRDEAKEPRDVPKEQREVPKEQRDDDRASRTTNPRDTTPSEPEPKKHATPAEPTPRSETPRDTTPADPPSRNDHPKTEADQPRSETDRPRGENPQPSRETEQPKTGTDEPKDDERDSRRDRGTEPDRSGQDILDTPGKDHPDDIDQADAGKPQVVEVDGVKVLQIPLDPPTAREVEDLLEHADAVQPVDLPSVERAVDPAAPADLPSVERAVDPPAPAQPSDGAAGRTGSQTGTGEVPATWANDGSDVVSADARPPSDAAVKSLADHASDIGPKDMPGVRLPTGEWGRAAIPDGIGPDGPAGSVHPGEAAAQAQDTDGRASAGTPDGDAQVSKGGRDGDPQVSGGGRDGEAQVSGGGRDGDPQVSGGGRDGEAQVSGGGRDGDPQVSGGGRDGDPQVSGGGRDGDAQTSGGGRDGDPQVSGGGRDGDPQVSGRVADGHAQVADGGAASSRVPEGMPDGHEQEADRTPDGDSRVAGGVRESPAAFGGVGGTGGEAVTGTGPGDVARWANDGSDVVSVDAGPPSEAALRTLMDDASDIEPMDMPSVRVPPGEWGRGEWVPENIRPDGPAGSVDPGGPTARPADADGRTPGDAPDANEQTSGGAGDADRRDTDRASDGYVRDPGGVAGGVRESPAAYGGVGGTGGEAATGTGPGDVARWANDGSDVVSVDAGPPSEAALRTLMDDASDIEPMDMPSVRVPPGEWGKGEWVPEDFGPDGAPGRVEANAPDRPIVPPGS